ncbi:FdhF/YdeP family oxidoreductase [Pokkaliibacter sp. CJK22405]|uniref:FdhF/YdeP family oxidoreductase n=1 Tax=Pokkaliibacter sp. CJK22405 TaxID=3384615 RepID=UPI003984FF81
MSSTTETKAYQAVAKDMPYYKPYSGPAGGWGALKATATHWLKSDNAVRNISTLLKTNQPTGFDCPGCAWGEKHENAAIRFCENGAKAVNWEATSRKVGREFFAEHSVSWLYQQTDYFLEFQGRLVEPMRYNAETDHYEPISWDNAYALIAKTLKSMSSPNEVEFYTSGRTSNEAAFLWQLFGRAYGTNNFPDCSNMCHEASGRALTPAIGIGKGTTTIDDFPKANAIFVFGQNPGTNHPRMLETLREALKAGSKVLCFNNLKERGLERFQHPQHVDEMLTNRATPMNTHYYCPKLGGDMAVVRGMAKVVKAMDEAAREKGSKVFDDEFIATHTQGMEDYLAEVEATPWEMILAQSGLTREEITEAAEVYVASKNVITTWAMGVTQHRHSVQTIQEITNLMLLCGHIGREGNGLCPVRGHSNVQGDRTVGINERPSEALLNAIRDRFGFEPPRENGHAVTESLHAIENGESKVFIGMGGNFVRATPDSARTEAAMRTCQLTVQVSTKLNRSHLVPGADALILPCLGRTDIDVQAKGPQQVTVEDSFSMIHASAGRLEPLSSEMRSEPAIIAGMAQAVLGDYPVNWLELAGDYDLIRDHIAAVIPGFTGYNERIRQPGGFYLGNSARDLNWKTATGKANFFTHKLPNHLVPDEVAARFDAETLIMQTLRSHDQYNTTVYGYNDRYRGIKGDRDVIFINPEDMARLGFTAGQQVNVTSIWNDGRERTIEGFKLVPYDIPRGNLAAYYPETNPLIPMESVGQTSLTPTSKSVAVRLARHESGRIT